MRRLGDEMGGEDVVKGLDHKFLQFHVNLCRTTIADV
jgi:hypothetical protein